MASTREFFAYILKHGVARTNRFQVIIPIPNNVQGPSPTDSPAANDVIRVIRDVVSGGSETSRGLDIMIDETGLPGKSHVSSEIRYNGDLYSLPYGVTYEDLTFSFKTSSDLYEKTVLDKWMNTIYDPISHEVSYLEDYAVDITINQLDEQDNVVYTVILKDAFPMAVDSMALSNADSDSTHHVSASFAYRRWINNQTGSSSNTDVGSLSQTPLGPFVNPVLSNPAVQRGLEVFERETGVDLEGEAVNVYNQVNGIVENTTGASINKSVGLIESIRAETEMNDRLSSDQKAKVIGIIDDTVSSLLR